MKFKKAPLNLKDFFILKSEINFIQLSEEDTDVDFNEYDIDIDYAIFDDENEDDFIQIFMKLEANFGKEPLPGYKIFIEGVSIYSLDNEDGDLTEEDKKSLIGYSGVSIMVNNFRAYLRDMTSYGPFGAFILPPIDLNHLVNSKWEEIQNEQENNKNSS